MLQLDAPPNTVSASIGSTPRSPCVRKSAELILRVAHATERRAHHRADAIAILDGQIQVRVLERLPRGDDRELPEPIEALGALRFQMVGRNEVVTSAALWLRKIDGSKRVSDRTADRSARTPSHMVGPVMPIGVMAPIPVTTTRRRMLRER